MKEFCLMLLVISGMLSLVLGMVLHLPGIEVNNVTFVGRFLVGVGIIQIAAFMTVVHKEFSK